ncbi:DUF6297 family protein [Nonomuraea jiangxiensis]|uniref:ABC-2 type transport system permease protein n=1 Tax=Nonomuraea jiangxiensis TaxID=633440 RepID=A0A1G7YG70_9ACTN|nr:DUF6297 family protein [Nonomuraea jiangxiensis]SDG95374.1 hypothetical protein SAMN05421869_101105 [Nonomuraea jiangxiensis]
MSERPAPTARGHHDMTESVGSVRAVRAFLWSRRRARPSLLDRYVTGFGLAMLAAVFGTPVTSTLEGLNLQIDPSRTGAGVALVALALAGFLATARAAGPVLLPSPDASWLLLSPLNRRQLLGPTGRMLVLVAVMAGALLGLGLVMALGAPDPIVWRVLGALALGVSAAVGGMALAVLGQASQSWQVWLTVVTAALMALAVLAVSGRLRTVLALAANAPLPAVTAAASGAAAVAAFLVGRAWVALDRIPTRALVTASTRGGHVANAAVVLDPGALTWIAEDNHWRARRLTSRRWPALPAPLALAWQDWRRLGRRPGRLAAMFALAALPAVLAQAGGPPPVLGGAVLAGALAVAVTGTSGARRDGDNPALARLIGVGHRQALAARAILPALLGGAWATLALVWVSVLTGAFSGTWWWLGLPVAPALAAAALRMAGRSPVDHSAPVLDTPGGPVPTGPLIWAFTGIDLALIGCLPAVAALFSAPARPGTFLAVQAVAGALVLAGYLWRARPRTAQETVTGPATKGTAQAT